MRLSQLLKCMEREQIIVVDDFNKPIDSMTVYKGIVRGIYKNNPINKMNVSSILVGAGVLHVGVE